jgi:SAM-dependent methyltransferase
MRIRIWLSSALLIEQIDAPILRCGSAFRAQSLYFLRMPESRHYNSEYYDAITTQTNDIEFYKKFVNRETRVLELGCGTGRVGFALEGLVREVVGVDISPEMLSRAQAKNAGKRISFVEGDITSIYLGSRFELIIAPFRVMQALEADAQVAGLFQVIREHLAEGGTAILNVFNPLYPREEMAAKWVREGETAYREAQLANGDILKTSDIRRVLDAERQVLHPQLIHRRYRDGKLIDEHVNPICMRYYYADQFKDLIVRNGYTISGSWGGYNDEAYGAGSELVVAFRK